jgi:hypothetical protein
MLTIPASKASPSLRSCRGGRSAFPCLLMDELDQGKLEWVDLPAAARADRYV